MKRTHSESETDDIYSGDEKDGDESCGGISRKKRRGIIEKRRRDRINNSLSELRRLVPAAFEKQGSAKLEKAEILQMTVDHLKVLHTKGLDALAYDPNKFAMDYHNIGFRECAAEVARYMVTVEGLDIQDPLRLRLMSHLQCFAAQREIASKQSSATWGWSSTPATPSSSGVSPAYHPGHNPDFQGQMVSSGPHPGMHHSLPQGSTHQSPSLGLDQSHGISAFSAPTSTHNDISTSTCNVIGAHPSMQQGSRILTSIAGTHHLPTSMPSVTMSQSGHTHTNYQLNLNAHAFPLNHHNLSSTSPNHLQSSHLSSSNLSPNLSLSSNPAGVNHSYGGGLQGSSGVKPYRPWGAEIAY